MLKIKNESFGYVVSILERDFFVNDYNTIEELIEDIESFYILSQKEKNMLYRLIGDYE